MKSFKILWQDNAYGSIIIQAESEQDARDKFDMGDYNEKDLIYKNGGKEIESIDQVE